MLDIWYHPITNLVIGLIFIGLSIGFYNHSLDWLMIYYGCAPDKKRAKMDIELIGTVSWICFAVIAMLFILTSIAAVFDYKFIVGILHIAEIVLYIGMHIVTFILCQKKSRL